MIKLDNVNKYFNRHKKNEIHVINNTTLEFSKTGLIALLGPSGSGKTTLLNTIGGLDNVNSGQIYVDGERITKRRSNKIDEIRNLKIGYIFQDYKLVDNMSVFDNVALSLKLIGLKDKEEIKRRVLYTLEKVNMARYKNRPAGMLSGGERQRVGIARALVKNPKIIIADEPTGNLDSKNSLEIMNIIKNISQKYLVILVTHEEELARYYATKIVELKDGVVEKVYDNQNNGQLNYEIENHIYLKDFKDIKNIHKDNVNIDIYRDNSEDLNIKIVFKNGNIYIENANKEKVEVVENNSNIELINDHKKDLGKEILEEDFDLSNLETPNFKPKYSSIFKLGSFISYGIRKVLDYPMLKKILLAGFIFSGMFVFYATSSIFANLYIDDADFITMNKKYLTINQSLKVDDYLKYEKNSNFAYLLPSNSQVAFNVEFDKYLQTKDSYKAFYGSLSNVKDLKSNDLMLGRIPTNSSEIVVDKMVIDNFLNSSDVKMAGFLDIEDVLNHEVLIDNMPPFKVVGISDIKEPNIYASEDNFINIIANGTYNGNSYYEYDDFGSTYQENSLIDYNLYKDKVKLVKGNIPNKPYEIIVNSYYEYDMPLGKEISTTVNNHKLKVVGYYSSDNDYMNVYLTSNETIKYDLISKNNAISVYSNDIERDLDYFHKENINAVSSYQYSKDNYMEERELTVKANLLVAVVILVISLTEILLMIRSSFLSRIKEVGIYRAIGLKKSDIYKMFSGEIIAITTVGSVLGIVIMAYIISCITKVSYIADLYMSNIFTLIFSIILVFIFNLVVGLIPVYNTIRKTPASILARYDVD